MGQVSPKNPVKGPDNWRRMRWALKGGEGQEGRGSEKLREELERESEKSFHKCSSL